MTPFTVGNRDIEAQAPAEKKGWFQRHCCCDGATGFWKPRHPTQYLFGGGAGGFGIWGGIEYAAEHEATGTGFFVATALCAVAYFAIGHFAPRRAYEKTVAKEEKVVQDVKDVVADVTITAEELSKLPAELQKKIEKMKEFNQKFKEELELRGKELSDSQNKLMEQDDAWRKKVVELTKKYEAFSEQQVNVIEALKAKIENGQDRVEDEFKKLEKLAQEIGEIAKKFGAANKGLEKSEAGLKQQNQALQEHLDFLFTHIESQKQLILSFDEQIKAVVIAGEHFQKGGEGVNGATGQLEQSIARLTENLSLLSDVLPQRGDGT